MAFTAATHFGELVSVAERSIIMACFLVSAAEAVIVTVVEKVVEKKEEKAVASTEGTVHGTTFSRKLKWLKNMLWGGTVLLLFEHIWHGEVVPFFPFLTAMSSPDSAAEMFHEMSTVGVSMALLVTLVWGIICAVSYYLETKAAKSEVKEAEGETA